jgi:segregation and condensation protein B
MKDYKERARKNETSLEIVKCGEKYAMQLMTRYAKYAKKLATTEIPERLLKTLALIAYHQPIEQSRLREMIGKKVYQHVKELHQLGLIRAKKHWRTKILTTSKSFEEYFEFNPTDKKKIAEYLGGHSK